MDSFFRPARMVLTACFVASAAAVFAAEEQVAFDIEAIKANADALGTSIKTIKGRGEAINKKLGQCGGYLDALGSSPTQVAGKDLEAALVAAQNLNYSDWNNLMTANKPSISELLLKDTAVRKAMLDIKTEVVGITDEVNQIKPELEQVQKQSATLMEQVSKKKMVLLKNPTLWPKLMGLGKDAAGLLGETQKSLVSSGMVLNKLGVAMTLLPPTDPLVAEIANVQAGSAIAASATVSPVTTMLAGPVAVVASGGEATASGSAGETALGGFWQGGLMTADGSGVTPVQLLLGKPKAGAASGFLILASSELQTPLIFREVKDGRWVFAEGSSGFALHVTPREGQAGAVIAERYAAGGAQVAQGFLKRQ